MLKAMAREPRDRYQSVAELRDDLRRFATGEPIAAQRSGVFRQAWKWSRRKPVAAALVAVLLAVALIGVPALTVLWRTSVEATKLAEAERSRALSALQTADFERKKAEEARERAEAADYASSMRLAQEFYNQTVPSEAEPLLQRWVPSNRVTDGSDSGRPNLHGWEWSFLRQQQDSSLHVLARTFGACPPGGDQP